MKHEFLPGDGEGAFIHALTGFQRRNGVGKP